MGVEHSPDKVWQAQELYCVERLSFAKVAERVGVSATTLKAWSKKFSWRKKREEIAQIETEIRIDTIKSRKKALDMLLQSGDGKECSQMAFAVSSLENLALKQQELAQRGMKELVPPPPSVHISSRADAVDKLQEAVQLRLAHALSDPEAINSQVVGDIAKMLDMMANLARSAEGEVVEEKDIDIYFK